MLREPPWSTAGGCGQRPGPPGPSRATGPAPACLAVWWGGGLRWLPGCPGGSLKDGLSTWLGSMWPLPAAPWLPDPAPLGCARQIPSSWDLPAISLSKDGVLGRGVCVRTERVRHEAAYLGFCSCPLPGGWGRDSSPSTLPNPAQPLLYYRTWCRGGLSQDRWMWAILGPPVPGRVPAPLRIPWTVPTAWQASANPGVRGLLGLVYSGLGSL